VRHSFVLVILAACGSVANEQKDAAIDSRSIDAAQDAGIDAFTCAANPAGLAGRWRAEMNVNDDLSASTATQVGGVVYSPGKHGFAFVLDGSSKYVSVADNDALWPSGSFSVEAWIKTTGSASSMVLQKYQCSNFCPSNQATALYSLFMSSTGVPGFDVRTDTSDTIVTISDSQHLVNDGNWHHLVGVRNVTAGQLMIYVDGAIGASIGISGTELEALSNEDAEVDPVVIGAGITGGTNTHHSFFNGSIDEVSYYSSALTAQEIARLYAAPEGACH
jgi:hypothetical protein